MHLGDLLNNRGWPNIDANAGGSVHGWVRVLETIMHEYPADALYIFGHKEAGRSRRSRATSTPAGSSRGLALAVGVAYDELQAGQE